MNNSDIWHRRLGHISPRSLYETIPADAHLGIPKMKTDFGKICGLCQLGKQVRMPHKVTQHMTTTRILKLLHIDLIGPMQLENLGGKKYAFVCVNNFSGYSWIHFLKEQLYTFDAFETFILRLMLKKKNFYHKKVVRIRSHHKREFENSHFDNFCNKHGIRHEFSAPKTPQHNVVVERKNITLQEMTCVIVKSKKVPIQF